jgi:CubicO group peptidase (beta-lactamase class C family)
MKTPVDVDGHVAGGFEPVAEAFAGNFAARGEIGAAVAVYHDGRLVVDLAGGSDPVLERPFTRESVVMIASCSKGAAATCVLMLVEQGVLDIDCPVAAYWPEFGQAGKQEITLRWILSHRAGLPYPDPGSGLSGLDLVGGPALLRQLERQAPWWPPGRAFAYHPITWGAILGEIVRRVTGQTLGQWFAANVAAPLGLRFWIGLPAALDERVVPSVAVPGLEPHAAAMAGAFAPGSFAARRLAAMAERPPREPDPHDAASRRAYYGLEVPAAHGIANARSLARIYAAVICEIDGVRLLSPETVAVAATPQTDDVPALDEGEGAPPRLRFGLGYQLPSTSMPGFCPASFGHTGAGGRLGLADPELGVGFGYVCNAMREIGSGGDPRWAGVIGAVRACLPARTR